MPLDAVERREVAWRRPRSRSLLRSARCSATANSMSDSTPITSAFSTRERLSASTFEPPCFGEIEAIHRARDIEIAVRIERAHETSRVRFEIALDRRTPARTARLLSNSGAHGLAAESLHPLGGRAVRHHAELARDAHAGGRRALVRVRAARPIRVAQNRFALDRAKRDGER